MRLQAVFSFRRAKRSSRQQSNTSCKEQHISTKFISGNFFHIFLERNWNRVLRKDLQFRYFPFCPAQVITDIKDQLS